LVGKILEIYGHTTFRLPPYRPDLNPIENIREKAKGHISSRKVTCNMEDMKRLCEQMFDRMGNKAGGQSMEGCTF
jgi:transposase